MPYTIEIADVAYDELEAINAFYLRQLVSAIEQQLPYEPTTETKNRKALIGIQPDFEHETPVWELRVGQYRVFYDVNDESTTVFVRAIRLKPPQKTTEQIV